jgi:hypothetical protein
MGSRVTPQVRAEEATFLPRFPSSGRGCWVCNASEYQEQPPNESDSIPKIGIELAYLPGSSVPRLMISIYPA